jgi:prefoldin subunit 5
MEYLKKWPSFSSKLQEGFHLDDDTNLFYVNRILNMAEKDVDNGIERTVEQWYDYIVFCFNAMQVEPKWNANYAEALANAVEQRKEYERSILEGTYKQRDRGLEISLLQRDKSDLKHTITQLQHDKEQLEKEISQLRSQLEANSIFMNDAGEIKPTNRLAITFETAIESYKTKVKTLEKKNKELQEKLDNAGETLTVLADGVKEYVDEVGVDKAYDLFNRLNTILIDVPAWTKHASALKKVFKKARKEMQNRNMVQGDYVVNKHVDKEVNGVSAGATGILINNNED